MSPFSKFLLDLRSRHGLRQSDLAAKVGYEQSYISALEIGQKGPPSSEFLDRLGAALALSPEEQEQLHRAVAASERKFLLDPKSPESIYWLFKDLRDELLSLTPAQIQGIRSILAFRREPAGPLRNDAPSARQNRKREAAM